MLEKIKLTIARIKRIEITRERMLPVCLIGILSAVGLAFIGSTALRALISFALGGE